VDKANGSRKCALDDKLRMPTSIIGENGGHGGSAPLPPYEAVWVIRLNLKWF
jgi:hypothetical protein